MLDEEDSLEMLRSERRSIFCPNKLWKELQKKTDDCTPISTYIIKAIKEKIKRDEELEKRVLEVVN